MDLAPTVELLLREFSNVVQVLGKLIVVTVTVGDGHCCYCWPSVVGPCRSRYATGCTCTWNGERTSESRLPLRSGESSLFGALVRQLLFTDERSCAAAVAISHQPCRVNQELALHALNQRPVAAAHTTRCSPTKRETRRGCATPRASARTVGPHPLPDATLPAPIPCRPP